MELCPNSRKRLKQKIVVITEYKPCILHNPGDSTVTSQQKWLLKLSGKGEKTPRQQWDKDMEK